MNEGGGNRNGIGLLIGMGGSGCLWRAVRGLERVMGCKRQFGRARKTKGIQLTWNSMM